jgi:hypothetical protein
MGLPVSQVLTVRRGADKLPPELVNAVFGAPRPPIDHSIPRSIELTTGDRIVFSLLSVKDGAVSSVEEKERDSARDLLMNSSGQREFNTFVARLREMADVKAKPES